jgi:hypothetical protein
MAIELCGDCLKIFEVEDSMEEPRTFFLTMNEEPREIGWQAPEQPDIMRVWRCPDCTVKRHAPPGETQVDS